MSPRHCSYTEALKKSVFRLARQAFEEDVPHGDLTSQALELDRVMSTAQIICRETVVMNGVVWYPKVQDAFLDYTGVPAPEISPLAEDGEVLAPGSTLFELAGPSDRIVIFERSFLNFLTRGIGIANLTRQFVTRVREEGCGAHVMDTRKTIPGFRFFDKYAVLCGGGTNHRMSLSDQVLVKENHIAAFGGIPDTLAQIKKSLGTLDKVVMEVRNRDELRQAIDGQCPVIMLDNFSPEVVQEVCEWERGLTKLEVSGGMTLENIQLFSHPKLDRVSIGALTHSVRAPDISLLVREDSAGQTAQMESDQNQNS